MYRSETWEAIKVLGIWRVLWYRTGYRPLMRLAHRFNWHHVTVNYPDPDGSSLLRCSWCGLWHRTRPIDYSKLQGQTGLNDL